MNRCRIVRFARTLLELNGLCAPHDCLLPAESTFPDKASRPELSVCTTAQRYPHIGNDGVLMYSDDDNDSFKDASSPAPAPARGTVLVKKGSDKRV
jgi:hypothetical protein